MCTVTYIPSKDKVFLTSNRDEKTFRSKALTPKRFHLPDGQTIIYPTDVQAGGTWIALKDNGDAAVLLNGAFAAHRRQPFYRKSRGLVFLEIVESTTLVSHFKELNLTGIEPFTLVLFGSKRLYECRWDSAEKFIVELNASRPYIWSSATLYDNTAQRQRQIWFRQFLSTHLAPTRKDVLHFHHTAGASNPHIDLCMNRDGKTKTVSITSIAIESGHSSLQYIDLQSRPVAAEKEEAYV